MIARTILTVFILLIVYSAALRFMKNKLPDNDATKYMTIFGKIFGIAILLFFIASLIYTAKIAIPFYG